MQRQRQKLGGGGYRNSPRIGFPWGSQGWAPSFRATETQHLFPHPSIQPSLGDCSMSHNTGAAVVSHRPYAPVVAAQSLPALLLTWASGLQAHCYGKGDSAPPACPCPALGRCMLLMHPQVWQCHTSLVRHGIYHLCHHHTFPQDVEPWLCRDRQLWAQQKGRKLLRGGVSTTGDLTGEQRAAGVANNLWPPQRGMGI